MKVIMLPQQRSEYLGRLLLSYGAFLLRINIYTVYAYVKAKLGQKLRSSILFLFSLSRHFNRPAESCVDAERRQHPDRPGDREPFVGATDVVQGWVWSIFNFQNIPIRPRLEKLRIKSCLLGHKHHGLNEIALKYYIILEGDLIGSQQRGEIVLPL